MQGDQNDLFGIVALTGVDRCWVKARRNNACFLTNKFLSVLLAGVFAFYTASLKPMLMDYKKSNPLAENYNSYTFIYWLLFIYYSFAALD